MQAPRVSTILVTVGTTAPIAWNARPLARLHGVGHRDDVVALEIAKQTWSDRDHEAIVTRACTTAAAAYFSALATRSHQRIDDAVEIHWDWVTPPAR